MIYIVKESVGQFFSSAIFVIFLFLCFNNEKEKMLCGVTKVENCILTGTVS